MVKISLKKHKIEVRKKRDEKSPKMGFPIIDKRLTHDRRATGSPREPPFRAIKIDSSIMFVIISRSQHADGLKPGEFLGPK